MKQTHGFIIGNFIGVIIALSGIFLFEWTHQESSIESEVIESEELESAVIKEAKQLQEKSDEIQLKAGKVGIFCLTLADVNCEKLVVRAENNPELKAIFIQAKAQKVHIFVSRRDDYQTSVGDVGNGYITINAQSSDEEIIAYLKKE